jgi:cell division protein FtsW (lipid II flippase)
VFLRVSSGYHIERLKATFAMRNYEHSYQQLRTQTFFKYSKFIGAVEFPAHFKYSNDVISEYDYLLLKLSMRWGTWVFLAAGLVMAGVLAVLIVWCVRQKGTFVKLLCGAVIGIFFVQVLEYFLVNVGVLDWATISLPFLTQGNFLLITNFALMGILFSAAGSGWLYEKGEEISVKNFKTT